MAGAEANTPSDPWAAWGDPQQGAAPPTEAAPLPDPPQEQGDQTVGDVPEHGADSAEWHGDDWNGGTSTNWWSTDEQWTSDRWRWDRWQVRDDSYGRWEWRHDCGTESTRDSDHGSNGGRWQDRRVSSADDDQWTRGSWQQSTEHHQNLSYNDTGDTKRATLSERMAVPSFSADSSGSDLGASARSYIRQIDAWIKVTRAPQHQQALLLYQHLQGRAWVESEELCVDDLALESGVQTFKQWIIDRYQKVEISKVAETLTYFFKKLRRQPGQSIREFNSLYDRAHTRLLEIECKLSEVAKAWAYLNALGLSYAEELGVLASVGNEYNTHRLQKAAILHEKSLKAPWTFKRGNHEDSKPKGPRGAFFTDLQEDSEGETATNGDGLPEEAAAELHEAYVAQETAKNRYREVARARGLDPEQIRNNGKTAAERLAYAKGRSFCSGCKRRGHWNRDPECPLNQGRALEPPETTPKVGNGGDGKDGIKENYVVHVAYEVGDFGHSNQLTAITDCACSKTVVGQKWIQEYLVRARDAGLEHQLIECSDEFRFGASKLFKAAYTITVMICLENRPFLVRAAVVTGEVPLLLSRSVLAGLGMLYDIENHRADFRKLGVKDYRLLYTSTGHPAVPASPSKFPGLHFPDPHAWGEKELYIHREQAAVYTVHMTGIAKANEADDDEDGEDGPQPHRVLPATVFFPKKLATDAHNMLTAEVLDSDAFMN